LASYVVFLLEFKGTNIFFCYGQKNEDPIWKELLTFLPVRILLTISAAVFQVEQTLGAK